MPLPRPCKKCGEKFTPNTSSGKLCDKCRKESHQKVSLDYNKKLLKLKERIEAIYQKGYDRALKDVSKFIRKSK